MISWRIRSSASSSGRSTPEPQKIWRKYSDIGRVWGSCAAMRRTLGLTVKVTSTISSSVGSKPAAHSAHSIFVVTHGLQRGPGVEHAAAAGTEHVPRQFEQPELGGVEESGDHFFLVEAAPGREFERVDATEGFVAPLLHQILDGAHRRGRAQLSEQREQGFGFAGRSHCAAPAVVPRRGAAGGRRPMSLLRHAAASWTASAATRVKAALFLGPRERLVKSWVERQPEI